MSSNSPISLIQNQKNYACSEANCGSDEALAPSGHELLARQTGQLLVTLGHMFVNLPAFSSHIDQNTGELLISLGNKLTTRK